MSGAGREAADGVLGGGVANAGAVLLHGDEVHRPASRHAGTIHGLLRAVRVGGFDGVPEPLALDGDRERLRYIPGDVPVPPFPDWWKQETTLASTALLMRRFHDATEGLNLDKPQGWSSELADPVDGEVICHNDVCPENVVYRDGTAVAFLDFDFAAPGRRIYDLAQFAKMCCPLDAPENAARIGLDGLDPFTRLRTVADAYGPAADRREFLDAILDAVRVGEAFVRRHVDRGEPGFVEMWEQRGGEQRFQRRARWLLANHHRLRDALAD